MEKWKDKIKKDKVLAKTFIKRKNLQEFERIKYEVKTFRLVYDHRSYFQE